MTLNFLNTCQSEELIFSMEVVLKGLIPYTYIIDARRLQVICSNIILLLCIFIYYVCCEIQPR